MSPKDYVARERVPAKKNTRAKNSKPATTRSKSPQSKAGTPKAAAPSPAEKVPQESASPAVLKFRIAFTLIVLVGFVVFLWNIKESSKARQPEAANSFRESAPSNSAAQTQDDLPELQEEEWEFMETLTDPDYEIPVEMPDPLAVSDTEYVLQCGSFRKQEQAESMRARIAFQGLEAHIKESNGENGLWYRVAMGPYERKRAAEKDRHTLQRAGFTTCRIW